MTPERLRQVEELFHAAREGTPEYRAELLAAADPEVRREAESLLAQRLDPLLDRPIPGSMPATTGTRVSAGARLGPYKIEEALGAGGMGEVYRALDTRLGRRVAIKVSAHQFSDRFEREARALAALNHPHICTLHDIGPNYLVMELLEDETLAARLRKGKLSIQQSIQFGGEIAEALAAAHAKGITHRDLKPGNIMLTKSGIKVLDFGLAKVEGEAQTHSNAIMGTPAYMAPEQMEGKPCDARTDIYALGLILAEMATGKRKSTEGLPGPFAHVVERCLERDPAQRWQAASDVKAELEWAGKTVSVLPEGDEKSSHSTGLPVRPLLLTATGIAALAVLAVYLWPKPPSLDPVRFQIEPPAGVIPIRGAVISPDGRKLVFPALDTDGTRRMYLREINSLEVRALLGTEGNGLRPIWSPDSRFLAYQSSGKLMKVDILGGPPQPLCDLPGNAVGGSWNRGGVILFGNSVGGILRVPENGGLAVPVTAGSSEAHTNPTFLPDGRHFLYFRLGRAEMEGIYIGSLDLQAERQSAKRIVETGFGAAYSPSAKSSAGWILFLKDGNLLAQPFDARKLEVRGDAVLLGEDVGTVNADGLFSVSSNALVYRSGVTGQPQLTWFDREGNASGTLDRPSELRGGVISPDGARVAHQIRTDIWLYDTAHRRDTRLTSHPTQVDYPIWSPDGRQVAFGFTQGGPYDLYQKGSGGGAEVALFRSNQDKIPTDWSSDGRFLLFAVVDHSHKSDVWALSMTGDHKAFAVLRATFSESQARFSPDTHWIAYTSNKSGRNEVYMRRFNSAQSESETPEWLVSSEGGSQPRWRRDGKELFYLAPRSGVMSVDVSTHGQDPVLGTPRLLIRVRLAVETFDVSSDGTRFLMPVLKAGAAPSPFTVVLNWQSGLKH